jgi:hypothetical protein
MHTCPYPASALKATATGTATPAPAPHLHLNLLADHHPLFPPTPLQACHESAPAGLWEAVGVQKLGAREGVHALLLSLWDPQQRCYVPFPAWKWATDLLARTPEHV